MLGTPLFKPLEAQFDDMIKVVINHAGLSWRRRRRWWKKRKGRRMKEGKKGG